MLMFVFALMVLYIVVLQGVNMKQIITTIFVLLLLVLPAGAEWHSIGNAEKVYPNWGITCYLGQLYPGQPIYWCLYADGSMDHSYFVYQQHEMDVRYSSSPTFTYTVRPKKK